jgi:hypothetical protein
MPTKITYDGKTKELANGERATLSCKDVMMETDVVIEAPEVTLTQKKTVNITANGTIEAAPDAGYAALSKVIVTVNVPATAVDSAIPIEVSTEAEMTALLQNGEIGGVYKYTGTTGTYENGALYVLEEEEAYFTIVQLGTETTYQFKQGMTWADWCEENYHDQSAYYVSGTNVYYIGSNNKVSYSNLTPVKSTELINSTEKYIVYVSGGSAD